MRMMPRQTTKLFFTAALAVLLFSSTTLQAEDSSSESAFAEILSHYEAARLALLSDSLEGISDRGNNIRMLVEQLSEHWHHERAGVIAEKAEEAQALLPALSEAATQLAKAENLETARSSFYSLSKSLVRLRKTATGELPVVAYCPMAKRSWLQPNGEIGNPYYGQSMPTCGEIVDS